MPLLWQMLRSRAVWLALLAALVLHSAVLLGAAQWHWPWQLPDQRRPSIMVQLLEPPKSTSPASPADAPQAPESAPAAPDLPMPPKAASATQEKKLKQNKPTPAAVPTTAPAAPQPPAAAPQAAEKSQLSLMQDMQAPDSVELQYQLLGKNAEGSSGNNSGTASLRWEKQENAHYQLLWQQRLAGKSSQMQSTGVLGAAGLAPLRYSESGSGKSEVATHFVADKGQIIFSNNSPSALRPAGVQDRISVLIQLGGILAAQYEAQALSEAIDTPVASASQMRVWRWQVLGLQPALPVVQKTLGEDANARWLAVRHDPSLDGGQAWEPTITVWYDSNGFLPMRIESRYPNGQVLDAQLAGSREISSLSTP